jgi:hypothetical protein
MNTLLPTAILFGRLTQLELIIWLTRFFNHHKIETWITGSRCRSVTTEYVAMCAYGLRKHRSRPAEIGDTLVTKLFATGGRGFASAADRYLQVRVPPGTELAFMKEVRHLNWNFWSFMRGHFGILKRSRYKTAILREIEVQGKGRREALEFQDGTIVYFSWLFSGQRATVLQLPAPTRWSIDGRRQKRRPMVV